MPATYFLWRRIHRTATVAGSNPTGTVQFIVNGAVYATSALGSSGVAQASLNLPIGTYTISAIYSGDALNAGSSSAQSALTVTPAVTVTTLSVSSTTTSLGTPDHAHCYRLVCCGNTHRNGHLFLHDTRQ